MAQRLHCLHGVPVLRALLGHRGRRVQVVAQGRRGGILLLRLLCLLCLLLRRLFTVVILSRIVIGLCVMLSLQWNGLHIPHLSAVHLLLLRLLLLLLLLRLLLLLLLWRLFM